MTHRRTTALVSLLVVAVLGAACSSPGGPNGTSAATTAPTSDATSASGTTEPTCDSAQDLPGVATGPAPWPAEHAHLAERLEAIGLPPLGVEQVEVHFHLNLVVDVHGQRVKVPVGIGIVDDGSLAEIHTHAGRGTIHVEAAAERDFTLGQVFDVWGVRFTPDCLGGFVRQGDDRLRVFLDGRPYDGDPTQLPLADEQVVVVTFGTEDELPDSMPARFVFEGKPRPA